MRNSRPSPKQLWPWAFAAVSGPVVCLADGNWLGVLITAVVVSSLCWLAFRFGRHWGGGVYAFVQIIWLMVVLWQLLPLSAKCWPTGKHTFPAIPLVLLALAAWSAYGGVMQTVRGACVLFWAVIILYSVVIGAGLDNLRPDYLLTQDPTFQWTPIFLLLLPALTAFHTEKGKQATPFTFVGLFITAVSAWIAGIVTASYGATLPWPFYESAKSVQLFENASRLEALVSVGATVGNYCMYGLLLSCMRELGDRFQKGRETVAVCSVAAGGLLFSGLAISYGVMAIISGILWILLPLLGALNSGEKRLKKDENSA